MPIRLPFLPCGKSERGVHHVLDGVNQDLNGCPLSNGKLINRRYVWSGAAALGYHSAPPS